MTTRTHGDNTRPSFTRGVQLLTRELGQHTMVMTNLTFTGFHSNTVITDTSRSLQIGLRAGGTCVI